MASNPEVATSIPKLHKYIDEGDYSSIIIMQEVMVISVLLAAILDLPLSRKMHKEWIIRGNF